MGTVISVDQDYNDGINLVFGTTTGTQIGTVSNQKLAFYGQSPIVRPTGDIGTALTALGLIASPTITALGGYVTRTTTETISGVKTFSGVTTFSNNVNLTGLINIADGAIFTFGSTFGATFGLNTTEKLGFYGQATIAQQPAGPATAGTTYGFTEQTMLQTVYNVVRNLGLMS